MTASIDQTLADTFGFAELRPGQREVIEALVAGRSAVAIFPTGGGKSLCYQLPAVMSGDGLTVVVSPLIALMKDQIDALRQRGVAAARLDSTLEGDEARQVYRDLRAGTLRLLYVAPERLGNERFLQLLGDCTITLLAVDEAHCISEWGHNFRPDYLRLARLAERLKVGLVLGLTATATPEVQDQIAKGFKVDPADVVRTPMHRPNLTLNVEAHDPASRDRRLPDLVREAGGPTVVYVTRQQTAQDVAESLAAAGLPARYYHAGMKPEDRAAVQDEFLTSADGVIVATVAFGMGIDKPDIRGVIHYNLPKSPENYAQELGRAGRDGESATCTLMYVPEDLTPLENFSYGDTPSTRSVAELTREVLSLGAEFDVSTYHLAGRYDMRPIVVETLLTYLELDNVLERVGPFYATYSYATKRPVEQIIQGFDPRRQAFLRQVFDASEHKRKWSDLDITHVDQPREKVIAALNYLEQQGEIELKPKGVRLAFRRLKEPELRPTAEGLAERFGEREQRDIERLTMVSDYARAGGGWVPLLSYFGEDTGDAKLNDPIDVPPRPEPPITDADRAAIDRLLDRNHPGLRDPRQVTRFLCGLTSPMTSRDRALSRQDFGRCEMTPFATVLDAVRGHRDARR